MRNVTTAEGKKWPVDFLFEFDRRGDMVKTFERSGRGEAADMRTFRYDGRGNWVRATYQTIIDGEHPFPMPAVVERQIEYYP